MVNMTHNSYNWRTRDEFVLIIYFLAYGLLNLCTHVFGLETKLFCHHVYGFSIESLVNRRHDTNAHQCRNYFSNTYVHHCSQLTNSYKFCQFQRLTFFLFCACLCIKLLLNSFALFLTVFGSSLILRFTCQSSQRLFYLTCYVFFVNLKRFLRTFMIFSAALTALTLCRTVLVILCSCRININTTTIYALALLMFTATLLARFFLTVLAFFFFRTLFRTCTLIQRIEIDLS